MSLATVRTWTLSTVAVLSVSVSLGMLSAPQASARPLPVDPHHRSQSRAASRRAEPPVRPGHPNPLLKDVLSQETESEEDEDPALAALCQSYISRPNPYQDPRTNVDQIVGDALATAGTQAGCSTAQNETTIAVNPENPRNIVSGTNDYRIYNPHEGRNDATGWAYTSFDGGQHWRNIQLPHLTNATGATGALSAMDSAGDPVVAFGPHNTVYYGNITFSRSDPTPGGTEAPSAITVNVSHDGGLHWGEPTVVALDGADATGKAVPTTYFNDKVWLAADPRNGRVYVTWTRFADTPDGGYLESPIVVAASRDYGRTFSATRRIDPTLDAATGGATPFSQGSNPQVGRDGTLYVAYEGTQCVTVACDQPGDRDVTLVATSTDHGRTFRSTVVDANFDFPLDEDTGSQGLTGENFRINSYPQLAYDPTRDRLAVTWADDRNGEYASDGSSVRTNGDNLVATSKGGRRWSTPVVVGTAQDEVFGAVAAQHGRVVATSYTRHYDPHGVKLDYAYWPVKGRGRGASSRTHRITTQSSDPRIQFVDTGLESGDVLQGVFIGDYTAVALGRDLRLHPSWTDFRGRPGTTKPNQDAYTATLPLGRR